MRQFWTTESPREGDGFRQQRVQQLDRSARLAHRSIFLRLPCAPGRSLKGLQLGVLTIVMFVQFASAEGPVQLHWENKAPMLVSRGYPGAVAWAGKIFVAGGASSAVDCQFCTAENSAEVYDAGTDTWSPLPPMSVPRVGPAVAAVAGKIYVFGGFSRSTWSANRTAESYDVARGRWERIPDMPHGLSWGTAVAVGRKIYVTGGVGFGYLNTVQVYDTRYGTWSLAPAFDGGRYLHGTAVDDTGTRIFIVGGDRWDPYYLYSDLQVFDLQRTRWETRAPMPAGAAGLNAIYWANRLWVFGPRSLARYYDPVADVWQEVVSDHQDSSGGTTAVLLGSKVYMIGGGGWGPTLKSLQVTDLADGFGAASLVGLDVSSGQLAPAFNPSVIEYRVEVPAFVTSVDVTPTAKELTQSLTINGQPWQSGRPKTIDLVVGTNTVSIAVIGKDGSTKTYTLTIVRSSPVNQPPIAAFTFTPEGLKVSFFTQSRDPDGGPVRHFWDFGDGELSQEQNPVHYYGQAGTYRVSLRVVDDSGSSSSFTQPVTVSGILLSVDHPKELMIGVPLKVRVGVSAEVPVRLSIGSLHVEKTGKDVEFTVETSGFQPRSSELLVEAGGVQYRATVKLIDAQAWGIIARLPDLEGEAYREMRKMADLTAEATIEPVVNLFIDELGGKVVDYILKGKLTDKGAKQLFVYLTGSQNMPRGRSGVHKLKNLFESKIGQFRSKLLEAGILTNEQAAGLDNLIGTVSKSVLDEIGNKLVENAGSISNTLGSGLVGLELGKVAKYLATNYLGDVVYGLLMKDASDRVRDRTVRATEELKARRFTEEGRTRALLVLGRGREAIQKTSLDRIYSLNLRIFELATSLVELYARQKLAVQLGVLPNPSKLASVLRADLEAALTIPAKLRFWGVQLTPDNNFAFGPLLFEGPTEPLLDPLTALTTAITAYMKLAKFSPMLSPAVISAGMVVGADIMGNSVADKYDQIVASVIAQGVGSRELTPPRGESESVSERQVGPLVSVSVAPNKEHYEPGETATVNVIIRNTETAVAENLLLWFVVPEEGVIVNEIVSLEGGAVATFTYDFIVEKPGLHSAYCFVTLLTEIVGQGDAVFTSGPGPQKGARVRVDTQPYYQPGEVTVAVTAENVGQEPLDLILGWRSLTENQREASTELPRLDPGDSRRVNLVLNYPEPGVYDLLLTLGERADDAATLDAQLAQINVRPLDSLVTLCSTSKPTYRLGEKVQIGVEVRNAGGAIIEVPYRLIVTSPSGLVIDQPEFIAEEPGTYQVEAIPHAPGYALVSGRTLFSVERLSALDLAIVPLPEGLEVAVRTEGGAPVQGATVIAAGDRATTNANGKALFPRPDLEEFLVRADKLGFEPAAQMLRREDLYPTLTVFRFGAGAGTIEASGCTLVWSGNVGTCTAASGTQITLTAVAEVNSAFSGWSNGMGSATTCLGVAPCTLSLTRTSSVTASFGRMDNHTATPTASPTPMPTDTPSQTRTATGSPTLTSTPTPTATTSVTPSPNETPTVTPGPVCPGDCGGDGAVTIDELVTMVNIALGSRPVADCSAGDTSGDGEITIDEIIQAVNRALNGC